MLSFFTVDMRRFRLLRLFILMASLDPRQGEMNLHHFDEMAQGRRIAYIIGKHLQRNNNTEYYEKVSQEVFDFSSRRCKRCRVLHFYKQTVTSWGRCPDSEEKTHSICETISTDLSIFSMNKAFEYMHQVFKSEKRRSEEPEENQALMKSRKLRLST